MEYKNTAVSVLCRIMMTHRACVCFLVLPVLSKICHALQPQEFIPVVKIYYN